MEIKRPRLAFSLQKKQGKVCSAFAVEEEEVAGEELPKAAVQEAKAEDFSQQTKSSSERFERYRQSLGAQHGPLYRRFAALLNGERGTSGSARSSASPGLLTATVSAMVQLADLRLQGEDASLVTAALELFEVLCSAVQELPQDLPPEAYMDGLRQRWRLGEASSEEEWGTYAARAAELFRLKDTVASLYAWSLLPRSTALQLLKTMKLAMNCEVPCILDPIAGTGLHGVLLKHLGAEVILADSVNGGSTQSSGADTQYLQQCVSSGSASRAAAAAATAAANAAVAAGSAVVWAELEHLDVFDDGQVVNAWWARHGEASNSILMLSFPPPPPSEVAEAALRRFQGKWLLFLGEWRGCTGSSGFFNLLEAGWTVLETFEVPRWPMMEDTAGQLSSRKFKEGPAPSTASTLFFTNSESHNVLPIY